MALNPQQQRFKELYLDPGSDTFGNAKGSALAAGYSEHYSNNLTRSGNDWVSEIVRDLERLQKAEKALTEALEINTANDPNLWRIKTDVAKFVAKGMAKAKYSDRTEHTGKDGAPLNVSVVSYGEKEE